MKKHFLTSLLLTIFLQSAISQVLTPDWEISVPGKIKWMQVNDWGILVAACETGLYGIQPQNGKKLWEIPSLTNIAEDSYSTIENTPLVLIGGKDSGAKTTIINGLNGGIIFDSEKENITTVVSQRLITDLHAVLIAYETAEGNGIALFDYQKADKKWNIPFEKVKDSHFKVQPVVDGEGNIFYCAGKSLFKIGGQTGEIIWQKENKKKYIDLFLHPEHHTIYAVSGTPSTSFYAAHAEGGANLASGTAGAFDIRAYEAGTGAEAWSNPVSYSKRKYSGVVLGQNDFLLLHTFSANIIDYKTGDKAWSKEKMGTGGDMIVSTFGTPQGLVYMVTDSEGWIYFNHVNNAGEPQWKKRPVVSGNLVHLEQVGDKLFYITDKETNFLDLADGTLLWKNDKYLSAGEVPISVDRSEDGAYVMYIRGMLVRVVPDRMDWEKITSDFAFKGELPTGVRNLPAGFLLTSNQNAMLINSDGRVVYHKFYEAPEQSFGAKLAWGLAGTAASATSFAYGASSMAYGLSGALHNNDSYEKKARSQATVSAFAGDVAGGLDAMLGQRFGSDAATGDYKLILTTIDKNIGFVKLNVQTGEEEGQIVTNDRTPDFAIDPIGNKVFLKSAADRVACYGL